MTQTQIARTDDGYRQATQTANDCVCGTCGGELVVTWDNSNNAYRVGCPRRCADKAVQLRSDVEADDTRARLERDPHLSQQLVVSRDVPLTTQAIRDLDNDKLMARVPDRYGSTIEVSRPMKLQLAQLARIYGLDPLWDLMVYEGRPYVTYDGRLRKLREAPEYRGHKVRPLSKAEKEEWGYDPADLVIQCDVEMAGRGTITDWGIVRASEVTAALKRAEQDKKRPAPVGVHTQQIAIKRAVSRASKQAVGIDLPTVVETSGRVIDVQEVARPARPLPAGDAEAQARRRFWSIARSSPPDGLGLDDARVHLLLGVESLTNYPGGWDQALSDLTERASAADDDDYEPPAETDDAEDSSSAAGAGPAAVEAAPAASSPAAGASPAEKPPRVVCGIQGCGKVVSAELLKLSQERFAAAFCRSHFDEATAAGTPEQSETSADGLPF